MLELLGNAKVYVPVANHQFTSPDPAVMPKDILVSELVAGAYAACMSGLMPGKALVMRSLLKKPSESTIRASRTTPTLVSRTTSMNPNPALALQGHR